MSRPETCPGWTFTTAYEYLQSLPRDAWRKGYRVRVLNALSRIVQAPDTPDKWDDVWFTCFKNCGDGSLAEAKRLLAQHDPAPPPAAVSATGREAELREAELAVLDAAVKWCSPNADDGMTDLLLDAVNKYAALRRGGEGAAAPTPADPKNPAPAPASGAAKANPKEP